MRSLLFLSAAALAAPLLLGAPAAVLADQPYSAGQRGSTDAPLSGAQDTPHTETGPLNLADPPHAQGQRGATDPSLGSAMDTPETHGGPRANPGYAAGQQGSTDAPLTSHNRIPGQEDGTPARRPAR